MATDLTYYNCPVKIACQYIRSGLFLFVLVIPQFFLAQSSEIDYDENMLDFWIGEWEVSWVSSDSLRYGGHNQIKKILNDKVIQENFVIETGPNKGYIGNSWSVFNPRTQQWKQTWVDNQGGYLDFEGKVKKDSVIFMREFDMDSVTTRQQRMVFYDIRPDRFHWIWQFRDRIGNNGVGGWAIAWLIRYKRIVRSE